MALNIRIPNPQDYAGAVLPHIPTIAEIIDAIPNVLGLWQPGALPVGPVSNLEPQFGILSLSAVGTVNRGIVGAAPAITFDANNSRLAAKMSLGDGAAATFMYKFYVRDPAPDLQNIHGPSGSRLIYRSSTNLQWQGTSGTDVTGIALNAPIVGWHTAEIYIDSDGTRVIVDGIEYNSEFGPLTNSNLIFGNNPSTSASSSVAIGPMFTCLSNIYGTDESEALRGYLFG